MTNSLLLKFMSPVKIIGNRRSRGKGKVKLQKGRVGWLPDFGERMITWGRKCKVRQKEVEEMREELRNTQIIFGMLLSFPQFILLYNFQICYKSVWKYRRGSANWNSWSCGSREGWDFLWVRTCKRFQDWKWAKVILFLSPFFGEGVKKRGSIDHTGKLKPRETGAMRRIHGESSRIYSTFIFLVEVSELPQWQGMSGLLLTSKAKK